MLPAFIIIGAMKAGTTSLYHYIASHPDIVRSAVKETDFFMSDETFSKGLDWYQSLFAGCGRMAFEASPNYTKRDLFPGVPSRMHAVIPDVKLIYVLRDPITRVVSHYVHNYAHGRESRSFADAIRDPSSNYIQTSKYFYQIQAYLEFYGRDALLLVESERLRDETAAVVQDIYEFLGLPAKYSTTLLARRFHESNAKKRPSALERRLIEGTRNAYLKSVIRWLVAPLRSPVARPSLTPADESLLAEELRPDVDALRRFSGMALSRWSV